MSDQSSAPPSPPAKPKKPKPKRRLGPRQPKHLILPAPLEPISPQRVRAKKLRLAAEAKAEEEAAERAGISPQELRIHRLIRAAGGAERLLKEVRKEMCVRKLEDFVRFAWPYIEPSTPYKHNWHISAVCSHLEALARGEIDRLLINIPPRSLKTIIVNVCFPLWVWIQKQHTPLTGPHVKFLCGSYGHQLSLDISTKARDLMRSNWFQENWGPEIKIKHDQDNKVHFANEAGGARIATSVESHLLGIGAQLIIVDDPHNTDQVESDPQRETALNWFRELSSTRFNDPTTGAMIVVMQRLHQCLLPGVLVRTPLGHAPIETLKPGDTVYGSAGWQQISHTSSRPHKGEVYGVSLYGHPTPCWTTDNHRFLTKRGWVQAGHLSKEDWVRFPLARPSAQAEIPWAPIRWAKVPHRTGSFTGKRKPTKGVDREALSRLAAEGKTNCEIARILKVHRNTIQCYMHLYGINRMLDRNPLFGVAHLSDPDFWRFVGYWIAEGSYCMGRGKRCGIRLTFGAHEPHLVAEVRATMARYGIPVGEEFKPSTHEAQIFCSQLARWFEEHFGIGAHKKKLPEFVYSLPLPCLRQLVEGWMIGDGCTRTGTGLRAGGSVSIALLHGMQRALLLLGQRVLVYHGSGIHRTSMIGPVTVKSTGKGGEVRFCREGLEVQRKKTELDGDNCWFRVRKIETKPYDGPVYDITTPSSDFVVGNATVHNSDVSGYIMEHDTAGRWVHLMLPMEFDSSRRCTTRLGFSDPRQIEGELLHPERVPVEDVENMKASLGPYMASGRLQQSPSPKGGGIINSDWWLPWPPIGEEELWIDSIDVGDGKFERRTTFPDFEIVILSIDTAYTEKEENDWSACTKWGLFRDKMGNPKLMLINAWRDRLAIHPLTERIMKSAARKPSADAVLIEAKASGLSVAQELRRLMREGDFQVHTIDPRGGDKVARMYAVQSLFTGKLIHAPYLRPEDQTRPMWADMVISELAEFPKSKWRDLSDTVSQALNWFRKRGLAQLPWEAEDDRKPVMWQGQKEPIYDV